jgi:protein-tyrosine phosphatase
MDQSNARNLMAMGADKSSVVLLLDYLEEPSVRDVPDPYYGGVNGFSMVFDLVADGIDGLLKSFE